MKRKYLSLIVLPLLLIGCGDNPAPSIDPEPSFIPPNKGTIIEKEELVTHYQDVESHQYKKFRFDFFYQISEDGVVDPESQFSTTDICEYIDNEWIHISGSMSMPDDLNSEYSFSTILNMVEAYDLTDYTLINWGYYKDGYEISLDISGYDEEDNYEYSSSERHIFNEYGYCVYEIYKYTYEYPDEPVQEMVSEYFYNWYD